MPVPTTDALGREALFVDSTPDNALHQLLSNQWYPSIGGFVACPGAEFTALVAAECLSGGRVPAAPGSPFASCTAFALPDNPPTPDRTIKSTTVRRFVLTETALATLHGPLLGAGGAAAAELARSNPAQVSNVGGAHSAECAFRTAEGGVTAWYDGLRSVVVAALAEMAWEGMVVPERAQMSGWLNASGCADFNVLHDHGTAMWSCVYFIDTGGEVVLREEAPIAGVPAARPAPAGGGCLVLRTQLEPFTMRYAHLTIAPTPGELWVFPGYLSHCVMPRLLSKADGTSPRRRLTAAVNVMEGEH